MSAWDFRIIHDPAALEAVVDLEIDIWGLSPRDAAPANLLHALAQNGSLVAGAYDNYRLIGLSLAFPAKRENRWLLWSHMVGIHRQYQGKGVGFGLKQFQRNWAIQQGYRYMAWTFDPLQSGNANFNLHILGATTNTYHVNFYGELSDEINIGLPSDRVETLWDLQDKRVKKLASGLANQDSSSKTDPPYLLQAIGIAPEVSMPDQLTEPEYVVEIPSDLATLKRNSRDRAFRWRLALRESLQNAFQQGYRATNFIVSNGRCGYLLTRDPQWFLYVVMCNDKTFYAGISPDVERRVFQHNRKRGAAYTAARTPVVLLGMWQYPDKSTAMRAELAFKKLTREQKLAHIENRLTFAGATFITAQ